MKSPANGQSRLRICGSRRERTRSQIKYFFVTEKNYLVMPAEVYKKILQERPSGIGVICPIPLGKGLTDEFENPTPFDAEGVQWKMRVVVPCLQGTRKRSMVELLFCMLRAGK